MPRNFVSQDKEMIVSEEDEFIVAKLLGRQPRGLRQIAFISKDKMPVVIQVASLVNDKPFPTLFWLVDKKLNYAIDQMEASGFIAELQETVDASESLQQSMKEDHKAHIDLRLSMMSKEQYENARQLGFAEVLSRRGIGGIENFSRIRCLHTYYASHLIVPNTIGGFVDDYWDENEILFNHL